MNLSDFLASVPEFSNLKNHDLTSLEKALLVRQYNDGHVFTREGETADEMYLIIEGQVSVNYRRHEKSGSVEIRKMQSKEIFGLNALIDRGRRTATCRAVGQVVAASLPRNAFDLLFQSNIPLGYCFTQVIARQLMRDLRGLTNAIRLVIREPDNDEALKTAEAIVVNYTGPERRKGDRRLGDRRKGDRRVAERRHSFSRSDDSNTLQGES